MAASCLVSLGGLAYVLLICQLERHKLPGHLYLSSEERAGICLWRRASGWGAAVREQEKASHACSEGEHQKSVIPERRLVWRTACRTPRERLQCESKKECGCNTASLWKSGEKNKSKKTQLVCRGSEKVGAVAAIFSKCNALKGTVLVQVNERLSFCSEF